MPRGNAEEWCTVCERYEPVHGEWRALWIDGSLNLIVSRPWEAPMRNYQQVFFACGQHGALLLVERYLSTGALERNTNPACIPVTRPEAQA